MAKRSSWQVSYKIQDMELIADEDRLELTLSHFFVYGMHWVTEPDDEVSLSILYELRQKAFRRRRVLKGLEREDRVRRLREEGEIWDL